MKLKFLLAVSIFIGLKTEAQHLATPSKTVEKELVTIITSLLLLLTEVVLPSTTINYKAFGFLKPRALQHNIGEQPIDMGVRGLIPSVN